MTVKRTVKRAAVRAGRLLSNDDASDRRVVFCYHSVHPSRPHGSTTPELFEQHVLWLQQHCRLTSLDELVRDATARDGEGPWVALTFDDGYEDNHSIALLILLHHGATATFYVTSGSWIESRRSSRGSNDSGAARSRTSCRWTGRRSESSARAGWRSEAMV
jgi:Polysaccharide deacetylase